MGTHRLPTLLIGILLGALSVLVGCTPAAEEGAVLPTQNIVFVTATPEGEQPSTTPASTENVIYVTATPPLDVTETPYFIFLTATPLRVGPHSTPLARATPSVEPTLDLSGVTLIPTVRPSFTPAEETTATSEADRATATPRPTVTPTPLPTPTPVVPNQREGALYSNYMGINFISSAQHQTNAARFQIGIDAGAGWDRFAIYWNEIEASPENYDWSLYDEAVRNDVIYGLQTDAILLGTPQEYRNQAGTPINLHNPVFADGTDIPGTNKRINPTNMWAEFVYNTVMRYKPGGTLARAEGWPRGSGVRVWEIWNEPDFQQFWPGTIEDYARLLKVAYIAVRHADPNARVMVGGLAQFEQPDFLARLITMYKQDPDPVQGSIPFDIVALHNYSNPALTFYNVQRTKTLLATQGLSFVPVWLNESGVALWDDYPGPTWVTRKDQRIYRATLEEQGAYIIANASFARLSGADKYFHFQLYDDCGNQPRGSTFPPHNGELCANGAVCWGDALGLVRNRPNNVCFNQHPFPGTTRPSYAAYHTASRIFGTGQIIPITGYVSRGVWRNIYARPDRSQMVTVLWNETGEAREAVLEPRGNNAVLVEMSGARSPISPGGDGLYRIPVAPATNRNHYGDTFMIGGPPVILIEESDQSIVSILPLLDESRSAALVRWEASRPGDIVMYEVYYRDDTSGADEWVKWFDAEQPGSALFSAGIGRRYSFFARGQREDGTWTADEPYSQAWTILK